MPLRPRATLPKTVTVSLRAFALLALLRPCAAAAQGGDAPPVLDRPALEVQLTIERRLLASDLSAYREARAKEMGARLHADEVSAKLDDQLAGDSAVPVRAAREAAAARDELIQVEGRTSQALATLLERLRRVALLERLNPASFGVPEGIKAEEGLAGRWQVLLDSQGPLGLLELKLSGPVAFGSLTLPEGGNVAIRGSHEGSDLRLEPIVRFGTPTLAIVGTLDPASGQLQGSWQGSDPATGQPAGAGTWTAVRLRDDVPETIQQEDIE